jgi:hypothetical protein
LEFGPHAEQLMQAAKDLKRPIPVDCFPPDVPVEFQFAYLAFCALSGDREAGFGQGPIRFTAIDAYARRYHVDDLDEFDQFAADIRLIDGIYLDVSKPPDK